MCNLAVDQPVIIQTDGTNIQKLRVTGSVQDCAENAPNPQRPPHEAIVDITVTVLTNGQPNANLRELQNFSLIASAQTGLASGQWFYESKSLPPFPCGSTVRVRAACHSDASCFIEQDFVVDCSNCPDVQLTATNISGCTVTFTIDYQNTDSPTILQLNYGDGDNEAADTIHDNGGSIQHTHTYDANGTFNPSITILFPEGCNDVSIDQPLNIDDCAQQTTCPSISFSPINPSQTCTNGRRNTVINTTVSIGGNTHVDATISVRNANGEVFSSTVSSNNGTVAPSANLNLVPGTYTVRISVNAPGGCPFSEETFVVPRCDDGQSSTPPPPPTTTPPQGCDACCVWFISNIILTILAIIAVVVAGCVFQWAEPISTITAIILVSAAVLSWILWAIFCGFLAVTRPSCQQLNLFIELLDWAEGAAAIITIILAVLGQLPCAIAIAVNWGMIGFIRRLLVKVAQFTGCAPNPFL